MSSRFLAVIPARGGSVGVPKKNLVELGGVPLVGRAVLAAQESKHIDAVYVTSDDEEILRVAAGFGAKTILRPAHLASSIASSEAALLHALEEIAAQGEDNLVFLQCTSPFTTSSDIDQVIEEYLASKADSALSVTPDHSFIWEVSAEGEVQSIGHDYRKPRQRRQDMSPRFKETGAIYVMRVSGFVESEHRFFGKVLPVSVASEPLEIDDYLDLERAHHLIEMEKKQFVRSSVGEIRTLITDFDGVHTDDLVQVDEQGRESVQCSRSDGMGIEMLRKQGWRILVLSKETNQVVARRAEKLQLEVIHGVEKKQTVLEGWLEQNELSWDQIAYIGNDLNDLECMKLANLSFAPVDAHSSVQSIATHILSKPGGRGALRELAELLLFPA